MRNDLISRSEAIDNLMKQPLLTRSIVRRVLNQTPTINTPCETCLRWPECNGVDRDNCNIVKERNREG